MALTLYTVSKDPDVAVIISTARMSKLSIAIEIAIYTDNNLKEIIDRVLEINHINGRANGNKSSFIESILVACASSSKMNKNKLSQQLIIEHFKLANATGERNLKKQERRGIFCAVQQIKMLKFSGHM